MVKNPILMVYQFYISDYFSEFKNKKNVRSSYFSKSCFNTVAIDSFPVCCETFPDCCKTFPVCCESFPICNQTFSVNDNGHDKLKGWVRGIS